VGQAHKKSRGPVRKNLSRDKSGPIFAATPRCFFVGVPAKTPTTWALTFFCFVLAGTDKSRLLSVEYDLVEIRLCLANCQEVKRAEFTLAEHF
jgi:hypothetical protein